MSGWALPLAQGASGLIGTAVSAGLTVYQTKAQQQMQAESLAFQREQNANWGRLALEMQERSLSSSYKTLFSSGFNPVDAALLSQGRGGLATQAYGLAGWQPYAPGAQAPTQLVTNQSGGGLATLTLNWPAGGKKSAKAQPQTRPGVLNLGQIGSSRV
nr:VP2 [Stoat valovirus 1]